MVFLRLHAAGVRVLARRGDGEFALRLQELQGVAGLLRALLFHDGENLVPKVRVAQVIERLARQRRVFDALLRRHEREFRLHQP